MHMSPDQHILHLFPLGEIQQKENRVRPSSSALSENYSQIICKHQYEILYKEASLEVTFDATKSVKTVEQILEWLCHV